MDGMNGETVEIPTPDGVAPCHVFHPADGGPWPAVVYYMDGMGIRPTLLGSAERMAQAGYLVLVPDLYYRSPERASIDHATLQDDPAQQKVVMQMVAQVTNEASARDLEAFLEYLDGRDDVLGDRVGCVGYCLGGRLALYVAGALPDRVAAAASIHGASLATDEPDSAHLLAPRMRAKLYVAVAEFDPFIIPGETERIDEALRKAGADYVLETYPGCHHGFALVGSHGYDEAADDRHRQRVLDLFARTLGVGA
jgi:carboxymethylenebutenolidase